MGADPAPDDVRFTLPDRFAVLEGGSSVIRPGHLEDARSTLDALDSKPLAEPFAPLQILDELRDGETFRVGEIAVTAHLSPGHTPGGTSWTWKSCEGKICRDMVFADSLTPVSVDSFKFTTSREYPGAIDDFEKSFALLDAVPCDVLVTTHPEASGLWDRVAARESGVTPDPIDDSSACRHLAERGRERLRERIAEERKL